MGLNVQVQNVRGEMSCPNGQGAKRPGPKRMGPKRPGAKTLLSLHFMIVKVPI